MNDGRRKRDGATRTDAPGASRTPVPEPSVADAAKEVERLLRVSEVHLAADDTVAALASLARAGNQAHAACLDRSLLAELEIRSADCLRKRGDLSDALTHLQHALALLAKQDEPILCGKALPRLDEAPVEQVVVTDTIPLTGDKERRYLKVLSVARLLGEAILRIHHSESVSRLFDPDALDD